MSAVDVWWQHSTPWREMRAAVAKLVFVARTASNTKASRLTPQTASNALVWCDHFAAVDRSLPDDRHRLALDAELRAAADAHSDLRGRLSLPELRARGRRVVLRLLLLNSCTPDAVFRYAVEQYAAMPSGHLLLAEDVLEPTELACDAREARAQGGEHEWDARVKLACARALAKELAEGPPREALVSTLRAHAARSSAALEVLAMCALHLRMSGNHAAAWVAEEALLSSRGEWATISGSLLACLCSFSRELRSQYVQVLMEALCDLDSDASSASAPREEDTFARLEACLCRGEELESELRNSIRVFAQAFPRGSRVTDLLKKLNITPPNQFE
eukprot:m51a1_g11905 hypothetical protein (332) ;mRNA; f:627078-628073